MKLIKACEEYTRQRLTKIELDEKQAMSDIAQLSKTMGVVRIKMSEQGITNLFDEYEQNKKRDKKAMVKQQWHLIKNLEYE